MFWMGAIFPLFVSLTSPGYRRVCVLFVSSETPNVAQCLAKQTPTAIQQPISILLICDTCCDRGSPSDTFWLKNFMNDRGLLSPSFSECSCCHCVPRVFVVQGGHGIIPRVKDRFPVKRSNGLQRCSFGKTRFICRRYFGLFYRGLGSYCVAWKYESLVHARTRTHG